jgi:predicted acyl esterase
VASPLWVSQIKAIKAINNIRRVNSMLSSIRIDQDIPMEMRDGTLLAADIYRPGGEGKYPAIIMRTPYHSDEVLSFSYVQVIPTVRAGYALVIAYVRGRFGSQGKYDLVAPKEVEVNLGVTAISGWRENLPWARFNGKRRGRTHPT